MRDSPAGRWGAGGILLTSAPARPPLGWRRLLLGGLLLAMGGVALVGLVHTAVVIAAGGGLIDFATFYRAAEELRQGRSPYPEFGYPPLPAIATMPLAFAPLAVAEIVFLLMLLAGVPVTLWVAGVRDWRCYLVAFCWAPVLSAIEIGNITILLGLASALAWRHRERALPAAASIGLALASKFLLWPLLVWLAATRKALAAALSAVAGAGMLVLSWAALGFSGARDYVELAQSTRTAFESAAYTTYVFALDLGASPLLARVLWLAAAAALLVGVVVFGRRGDERRAFALALAASVAFWPLVWLHSFELLLVAVAVAQPRLGPAWFVPLAMWVTPGIGGNPLETAVALAAAVVTVAAALLPRGVRLTSAVAGRRP